MCGKRECVSNGLLVFLGLLFGVAAALVWYFEAQYVRYVREMLPFALVFAIVLFVVTAILKAKCGCSLRSAAEGCHIDCTCLSVCKYSSLVLIAAAVFIVFSLIVLATYFPFIDRAILAFIGSIAFWTMLFSFIAMILCISCRRR